MINAIFSFLITKYGIGPRTPKVGIKSPTQSLLHLRVLTKARRFFPKTAYCGGMAGWGEVWQEFLGPENQIFRRQPCPGEENFDFFLAMAGHWLIFVYFGKDLVLLARICMFWRGETGPGKENYDFFSRQHCPGEENFGCFLTSPTRARINSRFFLARVLPCHKYLLPTTLSLNILS